MGNPTAIPPKTRKAIADKLRAGGKRNQVAKEFGVGAATVTKIAQENGIKLDQSAAKKARDALKDYGTAERVGLLNLLFDKIKLSLESGEYNKPSHFKDYAIAIGTAIDKRRLEDQGSADSGVLDDLVKAVMGEIDETD